MQSNKPLRSGPFNFSPDRRNSLLEMKKFRAPLASFRQLRVNVCLISLVICVFVLTQATAFSQEIPPRLEARVRAHIGYLASPKLQGRRGHGKELAARYIIRDWKRSGLKPFFDESWKQSIPGQMGLSGEVGPVGHNLGGYVRGTDPMLKDEWIIVNAHYDHLGVQNGIVYPGADDNASGVSMLLEVARQVAAAPLRRSVAFVAFDFEESLLWGSRWFIGHSPIPLEQYKLSITADMIGRSLGGLGLPTVFVMGAEHSRDVRLALQDIPIPAGLEVAQLGADMVGTRSDYGPFRDQEIPFLFFSTGEHPDYHSPRDTPDRIDYPKATRIIEMIFELVQKIGNESTTPVWEAPEYQKLKEAKAVHQVTQHLIDEEAAGKIKLSATQMFFVSQVYAKTGYMVRNRKVSDEERKWVARTAQLLLISIF